MKIKQFLLSVLAAVVVFSSAGGVGLARADSQPNVNASAVLAIDANSGQILYAKNQTQVLPIASISKVLTVAVIMDEIHAGKLSWDTKVKITAAEAALSTKTSLSNVALTAGQNYTVRQLVHAALIKSADAATVVLGHLQGDTTASFNAKMVKEAHKIGVTDAKIYNNSGLQNGDLDSFGLTGVASTAENKMSAMDIAKISQYVIKKYPTVLKITAIQSEKLGSVTMTNLNEMLPGKTYALAGFTSDGLKTGTSDAAGESFVGTGTYRGHRIITVILHANSVNRYRQTANLVSYLLTEYTPVTLSGETNIRKLQRLSIPNGKQTTLKAELAGHQTIWLTKNSKLSDVTVKTHYLKGVRDKQGKLSAPIKQHQLIGHATFTSRQLKFIDGTGLTANLKSSQTMDKANLLVRMWRAIF